MKKREFQKKATTMLLCKIAQICDELGENPNLSISSKYHSSYVKLKKNGNLIQIFVKETGELSYEIDDMLGGTEGRKIYYQYQAEDDLKKVIEKFACDFGKLYKSFILAGTFHGYYSIDLHHDKNVDEALREFEHYIFESNS